MSNHLALYDLTATAEIAQTGLSRALLGIVPIDRLSLLALMCLVAGATFDLEVRLVSG